MTRILLVGLAACSVGLEDEGTKPGECTDGVDNDADGRLDCQEAGCRGECGADADADTDSDTDTDTDTDTDADTDTDTDTEVPTCQAQYGAAAAYETCDETADTCLFFTDLPRRTGCGVVCENAGGECVSAHQSDVSCVDLGDLETCSFIDWDTAICECSRGCGGGPACSGADVCVGGVCG